jgi:hypothetical protein
MLELPSVENATKFGADGGQVHFHHNVASGGTPTAVGAGSLPSVVAPSLLTCTVPEPALPRSAAFAQLSFGAGLTGRPASP